MTGHDSIPGLVASWARTTPDAVALECRDTTLTYQALHLAAAGVAADIAAAGVAPGQVLAVAAERSLHTVVAILGALQAGCIYLPVDLDGPPDHCEQVVTRARPRMLLASPTAGAGLDALSRLAVRIDAPTAVTRRAAAPPRAHGADPAYLMPTSGTAGTVKLVEVTHRNVCYNVRALSDALGGVFPHDVYLHFASFAFSSSVRQLFLPLSNGARVVLATGADRLDPRETLRRMRRSRVSVLDVIPSVLAVLLDAIEADPERGEWLEQLRLLLTASERLPGALVHRWFRAAPPHVQVANMYGQTETAGIVCVQPVTPAHGACPTVPIGRPIPGTAIHLSAPDHSPAEPGAPGQIVVTGEGIATGYRADPQLTAAAFPPEHGPATAARRRYRTGDLGRVTDDGTLEYLGRTDSQVKVRGQRVDLAELERLLESHPGVAEAVVACIADDSGQARLAAAVRCTPGVIDAAVDERLRTLPNGLRILDLNRPETDFMYDEIFVRRVYLRHGITLAPDACIVDAGANIGLFSLFAAANRPRARVFAVEPAAPTAAALKINLAVNGCRNVAVRTVGLSDHRGSAALTFYPHSVGLSSVHANTHHEADTLTAIIANQLRHGDVVGGDEIGELAADLVSAKLVGQSLECVLLRVSDLMAAEGIDRVDLLKVDVQDSEKELLDGIDDGDWLRISQIVVEVHDLDGRLDAMVTQLTARGYTVEAEQDVMFTGSDMHYLYARRNRVPEHVSREPDSVAVRPPHPPRTVSSAQLLSFLRERVAPHQMPASLQILAGFPRTVSGKVDRAQITRSIGSQPPQASHLPGDPHIARIAAVWAEVLGKAVEPGDDFFRIGGNSLAAARVITRLRTLYDADLPIRWFFEAPRLDAFAELLRSLPPAAPAAPLDSDQNGMP